MAQVVQPNGWQFCRLEQGLEMILHQTRLADRAPASATEQEEIGTASHFFWGLFSEKRYDPSLELHQAAAS